MEKQYNSGNLYPNFNATSDPDGDGWNNAQEADSGTDRSDANPPTGFVRPEIEHIAVVYQSPEEHQIGSSPYFADTNDNAIADGIELAAGNNPSAYTADENGDGVPDNIYYSVQFEVTNESHIDLLSKVISETFTKACYDCLKHSILANHSTSPVPDSSLSGESCP